jgi:hypothetical protein
LRGQNEDKERQAREGSGKQSSHESARTICIAGSGSN